MNTIAPGYMDTALNREALLEGQKKHWASVTPMGRLGGPDELNGLAVFLASDAAGFVTGAHIYVDVSRPESFTDLSLRGCEGWLRCVLRFLSAVENMRNQLKTALKITGESIYWPLAFARRTLRIWRRADPNHSYLSSSRSPNKSQGMSIFCRRL